MNKKLLISIALLSAFLSSCARIPVYRGQETKAPACGQVDGVFKCFSLEEDLDGTRLRKMYPIDWMGMPPVPSNPN